VPVAPLTAIEIDKTG
jgi:hypothetical protein